MIGPATLVDLDALLELERICFDRDAWSETLVRAELDAPSRTVIVDREVSRVVGYASIAVVADLADLQRIAVRTGMRRLGYGRRLLAEAMRLAKEGGAERMLLEVASDNDPAIALYREAGFTDVDRRAGYYGAGRDAFVLGVTLDHIGA